MSKWLTLRSTLEGTLAARPAAASDNEGVVYLATDQTPPEQYYSTGTAWVGPFGDRVQNSIEIMPLALVTETQNTSIKERS